MKSYKDYPKMYLGSSDVASLTIRTPWDAVPLWFGQDGTYSAYIVDEYAEIGAHYQRVFVGRDWVRIYDDTELTASFIGRLIKVYRAGEFGCIIQVIKEA